MKKYLIATFVFALAFVASTAMAYDFGTTTLKVGSKGEAVKTLQTLVGATPVDGIFGNGTKAKVQAWQANNGLTADGLFGNASKAKANSTVSTTLPAGCTSSVGFSSTTGVSCSTVSTLPAGCTAGAAFSSTTGMSCTGSTSPVMVTGGAGTISATETSTDVETYMVEGQSDVKVLGFKVTATSSDAKVTNLKVTLTHSVSGSTYIDRYISDVAVWKDGSKIATIPASSFNKDSSGVYSASISLPNVIVKEGSSNKATFYVTITGISNIDSGTDMSAKWNVAVSDFRYQDGTGVIMSYNPSTIDNLISVKDINGTGDVKLVITKDSSSPAEQNVKISDTSSTTVPVLVFKAKNTGADMTFDAMSIDLVAGTNPVSMIGELTLKANGSSVATWTPTSTATTQTAVFDLDDTYTLPKDSTTLFTVEAKINDIDNFVAGSLKASYNSNTVFEVASTHSALTEEGAAAGEVQTFFANGIVASAFTYGTPVITTNTSGTTTSATYAISFKVSASGASYYIPKTSAIAAVGTNATFSDLSASGATQSGSYWLVSDGDTATFTTTGALSVGSLPAGFAKIGLNTLVYNDTADLVTPSSYSFSPASSFETSSTLVTK